MRQVGLLLFGGDAIDDGVDASSLAGAPATVRRLHRRLCGRRMRNRCLDRTLEILAVWRRAGDLAEHASLVSVSWHESRRDQIFCITFFN